MFTFSSCARFMFSRYFKRNILFPTYKASLFDLIGAKVTSINMSDQAKAKAKQGRGKKKIEIEYEEPQASDEKKKKFEPKNWKAVLENIREMRKDKTAAVDSMGCEKCADESADDKTKRFQKLVALMLSSQTKDEITFQACQNLKAFGFTPEKISNANLTDLENTIKPVGFYRTKAKHLQQTSQILVRDYDSDIPETIELMLKLPGVGKKMANIAMSCCWNKVIGIGVDTHVHRIANRLHWTQKPTKTPDQTEKDLESWLPHELWSEVNLLLVGFGQQICLPKKPKCSECLNQKLCPSAFKEK